jgi:hypothetical protein
VKYNMLEEEWIPILYRDGSSKRVNIVEAFAQAGRIRQMAASSPMDRVAILRFLLALLYWCKGSPPEGSPGDSFPAEWFHKLDGHRDCFNLLGRGRRFYQHTGNDVASKLSANYLVQEVPTGTNFWHFRHSIDETDGLCPGCCAVGLLRLPLFATSGGRGKPPGINAKPPLYVVPLGSSLADTLRFSWRQVSDPTRDLGTPVWERPDLQLPRTGNVPLLTGLTWLPRRVWLDDPEEPEANCTSCGRKERLIRRIVFAGIGSMKKDGDEKGRAWRDPHVISDGQEVLKARNALDASDAAAGRWVKIMAGILHGQGASRARKVWAVGFATVQHAKYLEATEYVIAFRTPCDDRKVQESVARLHWWESEGSRLTDTVTKRIRQEASRLKHLEVRPMVDAIRPNVEATTSANAGQLMAGDDDGWEQEASEYSPMMIAVAQSLSPGYTTGAVKRRREIATVKPNMRRKRKAAGSRSPSGNPVW